MHVFSRPYDYMVSGKAHIPYLTIGLYGQNYMTDPGAHIPKTDHTIIWSEL